MQRRRHLLDALNPRADPARSGRRRAGSSTRLFFTAGTDDSAIHGSIVFFRSASLRRLAGIQLEDHVRARAPGSFSVLICADSLSMSLSTSSPPAATSMSWRNPRPALA